MVAGKGSLQIYNSSGDHVHEGKHFCGFICLHLDRFVKTKRDLEVSQLEGFDPKVFPDEWQEKEWTMYKNI